MQRKFLPAYLTLFFLLISLGGFSCKSASGETVPAGQAQTKESIHNYQERKIQAEKWISENGVFATTAEKKEFDQLKKKESWWGKPQFKKMDQKRKFGNSVIEQRSGRMRLYDHNIFLRGVFAATVEHKEFGSLDSLFKNGIFFDIGSAIIMFEGAPTVRDVYEDPWVMEHLKTVIASDINDKSSRENAYMDRYHDRIKKVPSYRLPFPVVEIPMAIDTPEKFQQLTEKYSLADTPMIFRGANSGPDLYYSAETTQKHLSAMIIAYADRNVLYFFNSLVLFKHKSQNNFQIIGIINPSVGFAHRGEPWVTIPWEDRKLTEAFFPRKDYVVIRPGKQEHAAAQ